jgi:hypothetical protein
MSKSPDLFKKEFSNRYNRYHDEVGKWMEEIIEKEDWMSLYALLAVASDAVSYCSAVLTKNKEEAAQLYSEAANVSLGTLNERMK